MKAGQGDAFTWHHEHEKLPPKTMAKKSSSLFLFTVICALSLQAQNNPTNYVSVWFYSNGEMTARDTNVPHVRVFVNTRKPKNELKAVSPNVYSFTGSRYKRILIFPSPENETDYMEINLKYIRLVRFNQINIYKPPNTKPDCVNLTVSKGSTITFMEEIREPCSKVLLRLLYSSFDSKNMKTTGAKELDPFDE